MERDEQPLANGSSLVPIRLIFLEIRSETVSQNFTAGVSIRHLLSATAPCLKPEYDIDNDTLMSVTCCHASVSSFDVISNHGTVTHSHLSNSLLSICQFVVEMRSETVSQNVNHFVSKRVDGFRTPVLVREGAVSLPEMLQEGVQNLDFGVILSVSVSGSKSVSERLWEGCVTCHHVVIRPENIIYENDLESIKK